MSAGRSRRSSGQAMVEMAIGTGIFLLAVLGAAQLGVSALSQEGIQSAALSGARAASAALVAGDPLQRLQEGQSAALASLASTRLGMDELLPCPGGSAVGCGVGLDCVLYLHGRAVAGTEEPCGVANSAQGYGPAPRDLDGSQNPACSNRGCFGASLSMRPCAQPGPPGRLRVCVAYTSWPPRAVDIWITGTMHTLLPWFSGAGLDLQTVSSRLRLQVEGLA
ncbi:MAG: TadE family protein [Candidatus Dormibacteria bacterium]